MAQRHEIVFQMMTQAEYLRGGGTGAEWEDFKTHELTKLQTDAAGEIRMSIPIKLISREATAPENNAILTGEIPLDYPIIVPAPGTGKGSGMADTQGRGRWQHPPWLDVAWSCGARPKRCPSL